jgi:RNA polymerase sigma-70 factor, ECF subfamily
VSRSRFREARRQMRTEAMSLREECLSVPTSGRGKGASPVGEQCTGLSFESIFTEHHREVYLLAVRFLGTREDAEDVTQEVFTKVWRNLGAFNGSSSLKTWIYRIAINTCVDFRRKPWHRLSALDAELRDKIESGAAPALRTSAEAEDRLLAEESALQVRKAIRRLKPHLKAVLVMKELEEMSYDEISSRLGLSQGTISSRLNRARKALEDAFRAVVPRIKPVRLAEQS